MKLLLVIDVADDVAKNYKVITVNYDLRGNYGEWDESIKYVEDAKPRPLPHRQKPLTRWMPNDEIDYDYGFIDGYNACLEESEK